MYLRERKKTKQKQKRKETKKESLKRICFVVVYRQTIEAEILCLLLFQLNKYLSGCWVDCWPFSLVFSGLNKNRDIKDILEKHLFTFL